MLKDNVPKWQVTVAIVGVIIAGIFLCLKEEADSNKNPSHKDSQNKETKEALQRSFMQQTSPRKWYEGGTLHKSTMKEWNQASYSNKLATAADIVLAMLKSLL